MHGPGQYREPAGAGLPGQEHGPRRGQGDMDLWQALRQGGRYLLLILKGLCNETVSLLPSYSYKP
jgi:hypothetical protein